MVLFRRAAGKPGRSTRAWQRLTSCRNLRSCYRCHVILKSRPNLRFELDFEPEASWTKIRFKEGTEARYEIVKVARRKEVGIATNRRGEVLYVTALGFRNPTLREILAWGKVSVLGELPVEAPLWGTKRR